MDLIRQVDYVIVLCEKLAESRRFYRDVMRFPIEEDHPAWIKFRVGSTALTLRPRGPWLGWDDGLKAPGSACVQLAFRVAPDDVANCHAELLEKGIEILEPPKDQEFGHRTLFFRDPEGNIIEIYAEIQAARTA
jgi:glyoxylase I family protein